MENMYIVSRTFKVEKEHVEELCHKWMKNKREINGLIRKEVLRDARGDRAIQKVTILFYWESKEKHKAWQVHPDHIAGHKNPSQKPSWIVGSTVETYNLVSTI